VTEQLGIDGVRSAVAVDSDVELTPPEVFGPVLAALRADAFTLDPCSHSLALVPARHRIVPPDDGLAADWSRWPGLAWVNGPYSDIGPWLERCWRYGSMVGCIAVALVKVDTATSWWRRFVWAAAEAVLFLHERVRFIKPDAGERSGAKWPSALVFYGARNGVAALHGRLGEAMYLRPPFLTEHQADAEAIAARIVGEGER